MKVNISGSEPGLWSPQWLEYIYTLHSTDKSLLSLIFCQISAALLFPELSPLNCTKIIKIMMIFVIQVIIGMYKEILVVTSDLCVW